MSMTHVKVVRRISLIIQYEPSWFAECMSATGIFLWALFAVLGDDFILTKHALLLPCFCLMFGPSRFLVLFGLRPELRVLVAMISWSIWATIGTSLFQTNGLLPAEGIIAGVALGDLLTVGKFSIVSLARHHYGKPDHGG